MSKGGIISLSKAKQQLFIKVMSSSHQWVRHHVYHKLLGMNAKRRVREVCVPPPTYNVASPPKRVPKRLFVVYFLRRHLQGVRTTQNTKTWQF